MLVAQLTMVTPSTTKIKATYNGFTRHPDQAFLRSPPEAMCSLSGPLLFGFVASHEELGLEVRRIGRKLTFLYGLHTVGYNTRYFYNY